MNSGIQSKSICIQCISFEHIIFYYSIQVMPLYRILKPVSKNMVEIIYLKNTDTGYLLYQHKTSCI